jgi:serine/threonine protein phosphatase PrpC
VVTGRQAAGRTHIGLVRKRNEDTMYLGESLFAVADGMGGHVSGDVASRTVIEAIRPFDRPTDPAALADVLGQAVSAANRAMRQQIAATPTLAGMGTTLVAVMRSGPIAVIANMGDSRAYLLRGGALTQVTDDHVYGRLVANARTVPNLPERLARFLDGRPDGRSPDLTTLNLQPGDRLLLCSDGLSSYVPQELIHAALGVAPDPDSAANRLVALAIEQGAPDNVTVIVADYIEGGSD